MLINSVGRLDTVNFNRHLGAIPLESSSHVPVSQEPVKFRMYIERCQLRQVCLAYLRFRGWRLDWLGIPSPGFLGRLRFRARQTHFKTHTIKELGQQDFSVSGL